MNNITAYWNFITDEFIKSAVACQYKLRHKSFMCNILTSFFHILFEYFLFCDIMYTKDDATS